jgi:uncharacterized protein (TIGR02611 family)
MVTEAPGRDEPSADKVARYEPTRPRWITAIRRRVLAVPGGAMAWKVFIACLGGAVVLLGILLIPLPGPGWAIVFLGVAVWATEFQWARRLLGFGRMVLSRWADWVKRQSLTVRLLIGLAGFVFVCAVIYVSWVVVF